MLFEFVFGGGVDFLLFWVFLLLVRYVMFWIFDVSIIYSCLCLCQLCLMLVLEEFGLLCCVVDEIGMIQLVVIKMFYEVEDLFGVELFECLLCGMCVMFFGEMLIYYLWMIFVELFGMCEELVVLEFGNFGWVIVGVILVLVLSLLMCIIVILKQSYLWLLMSIQVDISDVLVQVL